jgi:hypothetical protein
MLCDRGLIEVDYTLLYSIQPRTAIVVETSLEATHWGSHWLRVQDPNHQVFALEEPDGDY